MSGPSDSPPMLPPGGDDLDGETMDSVEAGLLGSSAVPAEPDIILNAETADEPVEAELVDEGDPNDDTAASRGFESSEETIALDEDQIAELRSGAKQLGDFELERKIGQGGMGEVWLARQVSLDRPVAVKVLPRQLATQENFIERFQREAKAAASLVHPNVIQIYAYGIDEGTPYFAMEYVEGEDLQQRIRRERFLEWHEIVDVLTGVGMALSVAHQKGLIHRDIKPSNIMIDRNGIVKVMDFGLAKATSGGEEAKNLTNAGLIMGTPNYLSPEQGRGDPLDGRSDLYSLGIVLYELLTGNLPFKADTPAGLIFKHVYEPPPEIGELRPEVPPFLIEITLKLLEKDPEDRYHTAQEFLDDLAEFMDNYDLYVDERSERRPGSGYLDPARVESRTAKRLGSSSAYAQPGRRTKPSVATPASASSRRNAVTEPVTRATDADEEIPTLDPNSALEDDETLDHEAAEALERRERERARQQTAVAPPKDEPQAPPKRRTPPPPPPSKSKAPLVALLLLFLALAGAGYAWTFQNEQTRELLAKLGVLEPAATPGPTPQPTAGGTTPVETRVAVTPSVDSKQVSFTYEPWPEGVEIELKPLEHDPISLKPNSTGSYALGDYTITYKRRGYAPIQVSDVKLQRDPEEETAGVLQHQGRDVAGMELSWVPTPTLIQSYKAARAALQEDRLADAHAQLRKAMDLDPNFRPESGPEGGVNPTVSALSAQVEQREQELAKAQERLRELFGKAQRFVDELRWREAKEALQEVPGDKPEGWEALIQRCQTEINRGDDLVSQARASLARGAHDEVEADLTKLGKIDPRHPQREVMAKELDTASDLRKRAMASLDDTPLFELRGNLDLYLTKYGPKDVEARQRMEEVEAQIAAATKLEERLQDLQAIAKAGKWQLALRTANRILADEPSATVAQEIRAQAEQELAKAAITEQVNSLDQALVAAKVDDALLVLDPKGSAYQTERDALLRLRAVEGQFLESTHRDLSVRIEGVYADVLSQWEFKLSVLGQPPRSYSANHRLRLRRDGKRWLISELLVEGGVRAR